MSVLKKIHKYSSYQIEEILNDTTEHEVINVLQKQQINEHDYLILLSKSAEKHLEKMAERANQLTINNFGRVIFLYTPLYLSNYCVNECLYCGFNVKNKIKRHQLTYDELESEAKIISETGLKHILVLTGESKQKASVEYIKGAIKILKKYFTSISIEIYPLSQLEYKQLIDEGVDGLTIYQEVYDRETYKKLHVSGPKTDYDYRLVAPERACKAGIRSINIGALFGLFDWRKEAFFTGLHANYLQNNYPDTEVSVSFPRMRPHKGLYKPDLNVTDKNLVQMMMATRLYNPRAGITVSTRETAELRDNIMGLGVTKMSAGSTTKVGGHSRDDNEEGQFDICDSRNVEDMKKDIYKRGYQPVLKDWQSI